MAGRGRGRGFRATFSLDPEQPTPLYPVLEQKPLPLCGGEQVEYLLALKQEFRGASRNLPSFLQNKVLRRDVERYSDKYHSQDQDQDWSPDWTRFPKELRVRPQKLRPPGSKATPLSPSEAPKPSSKSQDKHKDVLQKLESLEQKETRTEEEEEEEEKKGEEEEAEEEQVDEDEFEEETDYIMSYFDNGEEFGGDSDENMDEATY
ncbi:DNA-directed RNA polymerase III subunit RPC7-like [Eucyclogobius newberryi]|uniref:DNA-directed RNA polymerase III subunit RPC7-like n=1 Tax=Eucyclogobius newberryi TaxID=166745 RepID=UPI003B5CF440